MRGEYPIFIFLSCFLSFSSATTEDFSEESYPKIIMKVVHLEQARRANNYSFEGITIPAAKGFIELSCEAPIESIEASLGYRRAQTLKGVKWILPNPNVVTERRAYLSPRGGTGSLSSRIAISEFGPEDAGEYTCQIELNDGTTTQYKRSIYIPNLDGDPIMACELKCQRNLETKCQLIGPFSVSCRVFTTWDVETECVFQECDTEQQCTEGVPARVPQGIIPSFFSDETATIYKQFVFSGASGLATSSGTFVCSANRPGSVTTQAIFMPVSVAITRKRGDRIFDVAEIQGPKPTFLSSRRPEFISAMSGVELGCWTSKDIGGVGNFQWSFKDLDGNAVDIDSSNSRPGISVRSKQVFGGVASMLHIESLSNDLGGTYTCRGFSQSESVLLGKEFRLPGAKWAEDSDIGNRKSLTTSLGSTITIHCNVISIAEPTYITWRKKATANSEPEKIFESARIVPNRTELTISNVGAEDAGFYQCRKYRGSVGDDFTGEIQLIVKDSPLDPYQKIQPLRDVVNTLKQAGHDICDVIRSFDPAN